MFVNTEILPKIRLALCYGYDPLSAYPKLTLKGLVWDLISNSNEFYFISAIDSLQRN